MHIEVGVLRCRHLTRNLLCTLSLPPPALPLGWVQARPTFDKPRATPAENGFPLKNDEDEVRLTPTRNTSMTVLPRGRRRRFGQTVVRRRSLATTDPWEAGARPGRK